MRVLERLGQLDAKAFTRLRAPGEPAADYLRRVAAFRRTGFGGLVAVDVHVALREMFGPHDGGGDR